MGIGKLLRRLRGLAGVGVTWGAMWAGIGAGIGLVIGIVEPDVWRWSNPIIEWAYGMGLYGFVSGVGFGTLLSLKEGRKRLFDLSLGRVALWGLLSSAAVPVIFSMLGVFGVAGGKRCRHHRGDGRNGIPRRDVRTRLGRDCPLGSAEARGGDRPSTGRSRRVLKSRCEGARVPGFGRA